MGQVLTHHNLEIIYCRTHGQGTGDTMTLNATDFGTYTVPTQIHIMLHYWQQLWFWLLLDTGYIKLQCMEIYNEYIQVDNIIEKTSGAGKDSGHVIQTVEYKAYLNILK